MTPFLIFLIVVTILALVGALGVCIYRKRWWVVVFLLIILVAFIILAYYLPSRTMLVTAADMVTIQADLGDTSLLIPIYGIILPLAIMFLIILMVAGTVIPTSDGAGGLGAVGGLVLAFLLALILIMPSIYVYYRAFMQASVVLTLGILSGATILSLASSAITTPFIRARRFGSQTVSHVLYYFSLGALAVVASNCDSPDNVFMLIAASVLASACATLGIVVESNAWNI